MKAKITVHKGCPLETTWLKCFAYDNGQLCGEPAVKLDPIRGCYVCERHATESINRLKAEAAGSLDVLPQSAVQLSL